MKAVWVSFEIIIQALNEVSISNEYDRNAKTKAFGLKKKSLEFDFIVSLMFIKNIMYKQKTLTEQLQNKELNIIDALMLINSCIIRLSHIRDVDQGMIDLIIQLYSLVLHLILTLMTFFKTSS